MEWIQYAKILEKQFFSTQLKRREIYQFNFKGYSIIKYIQLRNCLELHSSQQSCKRSIPACTFINNRSRGVYTIFTYYQFKQELLVVKQNIQN